MRIVNLMEDTKGVDGLLFEHGLCFYVETKNHKLLVDTGATDAFIENAKKLEIDLSKVDTVIISHGHYDHTGGVLAFANINPEAKIYIQKTAQGDFYNYRNQEEKYIGMDKKISFLSQVVFLEGNYKIDDELFLFTGVTGRKLWPKGNEILKKKCNGVMLQDDFCHEQYLVISENENRVLLSGCAHNGILNILDAYKNLFCGEPTYVISGFHTMKKEYLEEDDEIIRQTGNELKKMQTKFFSGHCTGEYPLKILKEILKEKLIVVHSGDVIL